MVAFPVPLAPLTMVTHGSETTALQEQAELVDKFTEPGPPDAGTASVVGLIVKVQVTPAWKIV